MRHAKTDHREPVAPWPAKLGCDEAGLIEPVPDGDDDARTRTRHVTMEQVETRGCDGPCCTVPED